MITYLLIGLVYCITIIVLSWADLKIIWNYDREDTALKVFYFICAPVGITVLWPFFIIWGVVESNREDEE